MKIDFTHKEYRTLIELLHLADWMLHAHHVGERPETADYRDVIQMIFSHYKVMRCEDVLECFEAVIPTRLVEDRMWPVIDAYNSETFWEQIAARLAERDAKASVGHKQYAMMNGRDRSELIGAHEERWQEEFKQHGLMRLIARDTQSDALYQAHEN